MADDLQNVKKNDMHITQNNIPIISPQNQDESIIREVPAISTQSMSRAAYGEESKKRHYRSSKIHL